MVIVCAQRKRHGQVYYISEESLTRLESMTEEERAENLVSLIQTVKMQQALYSQVRHVKLQYSPCIFCACTSGCFRPGISHMA